MTCGVTTLPPPVVECAGCSGKGFHLGPLDEETGERPILEHDRCNGAGILIRRIPANGGEPFYGALKLR